MIERGQVYVRAVGQDGKWGSYDALDLDDESFRRFVLYMLDRAGLLTKLKTSDDTPLRVKPDTPRED